ncbi:MAG: hypothetical protein OEW60_06730 [Thiovulaceae bacterium]|nr:hypothetical protein [Sulfurimonadaceae bacterium]
MIILQDKITINVKPSVLFEWFEHLDKNYLLWHQDHLACHYEKGDSLKVGSVIYVQEYLHGKLHSLKFRLTKVVTNRMFEYRIIAGVNGSFQFLENKDRTDFIAQLRFGYTISLLGPLLDSLAKVVFSFQIKALKQHMKEEGENLRSLLEK